MHDYEVYQIAGKGIWLLFVFAFGACAGSLINVLVYRLPRGLGVVSPSSRCPACDTCLTWRENIPVFGWIFLRGKCRFCKSQISAEYPLVEAFVGLLLVLAFFLWYFVPADASFLGIPIGMIRPEWAMLDAREGWPRTSWPMFIVLEVLLALLVAMTLVDAKTSTIPLQLPWAATVTGLIFHVGYAIYLSATHQPFPSAARGWIWSIPTPGGSMVSTPHAWWWIGASVGGIIGIGLSLALLSKGLLRRSFDDYLEWEERELAAQKSQAAMTAPGDGSAGNGLAAPVPAESRVEELKPTDSRRAAPRFFGPVFAMVATMVTLSALGWVVGVQFGVPRWIGLVVGVLAGTVVAGVVYRRQHPEAGFSPEAMPAGNPTMWIAYPYARREMVKELAFLAPCVLLACIGGFGASRIWGGVTPPLWLLVLSGVLMGYLIGGGIVWAVRIGGSLGFGKEAMGLGDVHLMAGVGACVGWIDAAIAFPLAAGVGLIWWVVSALGWGKASRTMPFGPYLAVATVLVIFGKPLIEQGLAEILVLPPGERVNLP